MRNDKPQTNRLVNLCHVAEIQRKGPQTLSLVKFHRDLIAAQVERLERGHIGNKRDVLAGEFDSTRISP